MPDYQMNKLNVLKFILNFNEEKIYEHFPLRRNSVYAKSIKFIVPSNMLFMEKPESINTNNFILPNEKYYGVNFKKIKKGYLEFRYIGGKNYESKIDKILEIIDMTIDNLYESIKDMNYNKKNLDQLNAILEDHKILTASYKNYKQFYENFPNIRLLVDLDNDPNRINLYYPKIRDELFKIISEAGMKKGFLNYDTNKSRLQIKDATLEQCYNIENVDIIECKIIGTIKSCDIFDTTVENCEIEDSNLFLESQAKFCKIKNSYINRSVTLNGCYVFGVNNVMNGKMEGGVFKEGRVTNLSRFSDSTDVYSYQKIM
jgi:hypothetical protein